MSLKGTLIGTCDNVNYKLTCEWTATQINNTTTIIVKIYLQAPNGWSTISDYWDCTINGTQVTNDKSATVSSTKVLLGQKTWNTTKETEVISFSYTNGLVSINEYTTKKGSGGGTITLTQTPTIPLTPSYNAVKKIRKNTIVLYEFNETNFNHNGLKILRPIECIINRNLADYTYDLDMICPLDDEGNWKYIVEDRIIRANNQLFRIVYTDVSVENNEVTVYAKHIFFDLQKNFIEDTNIVSKNGSSALSQLLSSTSYEHSYTSYSDISKINSLRCVRKNVLDALLGDEDNTFINRWGGEFDVDNFNLKLVKQVGSNYGYKIKYGKNLTGLNLKTDYTEIVTRIRPIGFDGIDLGDNKYIDSPNINKYSMPIIKEIKYEHVKWTGSPNYEEREDDDKTTVYSDLSLARAELRRLASLEFSEYEIDLPRVTCEINFIELSNTEEYIQFKTLETVSLGDVVTIEHKPLNINMKARCIGYKYDCIKQQHEEIIIGYFQKNFFTETSKNNDKISNNDFDFSEQLQTVYAQSITKMTEIMNSNMNGYVVLSNSEILIMDTDNKSTAKNVWRFNSGGISHSSTGYNGTYTVGMTMDGHINGSVINAGTIRGEMMELGTITARELAVEIQNQINTAMTEETTQALITSNLDTFESSLSQTFITQENATKQIQDATEVAVEQATQSIVSESVTKAMESVNDQLDDKLNSFTTDTMNPALQNAIDSAVQDSKDYVIEVVGDYYTKDETNSAISQTREEIELTVSETYETQENTSIKITEAIDGVTVGAINRVLGTAEEKSVTFTGTNNQIFVAYNITPDISDKEVIISFEYDFNGSVTTGSSLKFQSQYLSTSNTMMYQPSYTFIESDSYKKINVTNQQVTFTSTFHALQQDAKFRFRADGVTGTFTIRKAQIKVGNKVTEWSIAPEDIEENANNYTIEQLKNYYTKTVTDSKIEQTKNSIELGVSQKYETIANVTTKVQNTLDSSKTYTDNKATSTLNSANKNLTNTIANYYTKDAIDSKIEILQDSIDLGVETTEEVKTEITEQINNITVGGTNLLLETGNPKTVSGLNVVNQCTNLYLFADKDKHFCGINNTTITVSFEYIATSGSTGTFTIQTNGEYNSSLGETGSYYKYITDIYNVSQNRSGKVSKTITLSDDKTKGFTGVQLRMDNFYGKLTISNLKIERGNKATDWSPNPQDIESNANDYTENRLVNYYTKEGTLAQINIAKNSITNTVQNTYVSKLDFQNLSIGGENLISNSTFNYGFTNWQGSTNKYIITQENSLHYNQTALTETKNYQVATVPIDVSAYVGKELTLTFRYNINNKSNQTNTVIGYIRFFDADHKDSTSQADSIGYSNCYYASDYVNGKTRVYQKTITIPSGTKYVRVGAYQAQNGIMYWNDFQLEVGNKPTAWKPNSQDIHLSIDSTINTIFGEVEDISQIVATNSGSDAIIPSMKVKLISEYNDSTVIYNKLNSMYSTLGDTSFQSLPTELRTARTNLTNVISPLQGSLNTASETGLSNVLDKFNKFYEIAEELSKAISNSLAGTTKEIKSSVTQLAESFEINFSQTKSIGEKVDELSTHFIFNTDGMTIKSTQNATKTIKLDNDSLDFMDDNVMVAQVSDQKLTIENAEITNEMKIGNIKIKPSGKGGIMFIYE